MPTSYYRYVDERERRFIEDNRFVMSKSGFTFFTPDRYDTAAEAQKYLALPAPQPWRIGPIPADEMPDLEVPLRPVGVANGQPGGGTECATVKPVYLYSVSKLG
jgi:hypothetical protein